MLGSDEKNVDVVVVGTGLTNCLIAAALARNGTKVLHVDAQTHYGDTWESMSLMNLEKWATKSATERTMFGDEEVGEEDAIPDGLIAVALEERTGPYSNRQFLWYPFAEETPQAEGTSTNGDDDAAPVIAENDVAAFVDAPTVIETSVIEADGASNENRDSACTSSCAAVTDTVKDKLTPNMCLVTVDLCPKLFYSKSDFIDVCIESSVARYLEFQGLQNPLTVFTDTFSPIPTSKSEIFQNKELTLHEKRLLMKFITSVSKSFAFQTPATLGRDVREARDSGRNDDLEGTWSDWLHSQQLTPRLRHFLTYGICLAQESLSATEGLRRLKQFTESFMIYGQSSPLLYPMYGTGDIPQAFTRVAALHGTVYVLRTSITHVLKDEHGTVKGVQTHRGEVVRCEQLVIPPGYLGCAKTTGPVMLRLVAVTCRRLLPDDGLALSVTLPSDSLSSAQILQLDHSCGVCPSGLYVYHLCAVADRPDNLGLHELLERLLGEHKASCIATCSYVHHTIASSSGSERACPGALVTSESQPLPGFTLHPDVLREARDTVAEGEFLRKPAYVVTEEKTQQYDALEALSDNLSARLNEPETSNAEDVTDNLSAQLDEPEKGNAEDAADDVREDMESTAESGVDNRKCGQSFKG